MTVFSPDDLALVKEGPANRRAYLDSLLAAVSPRLGAVATEYDRVVRQRTALLRAGVRDQDDRATLDVWDAQLVAKGGELARARLRLLERLESALVKAYGNLAETARAPGAGAVSATYEASWYDGPLHAADGSSVDDALHRALDAHRRQEHDRGMTLVGPHRDDWRLSVGGLDARTQASQGEQRCLALALRLAGHAVTTDIAGGNSTFGSATVTATFNDRLAACPFQYTPQTGPAISICD